MFLIGVPCCTHSTLISHLRYEAVHAHSTHSTQYTYTLHSLWSRWHCIKHIPTSVLIVLSRHVYVSEFHNDGSELHCIMHVSSTHLFISTQMFLPLCIETKFAIVHRPTRFFYALVLFFCVLLCCLQTRLLPFVLRTIRMWDNV